MAKDSFNSQSGEYAVVRLSKVGGSCHRVHQALIPPAPPFSDHYHWRCHHREPRRVGRGECFLHFSLNPTTPCRPHSLLLSSFPILSHRSQSFTQQQGAAVVTFRQSEPVVAAESHIYKKRANIEVGRAPWRRGQLSNLPLTALSSCSTCSANRRSARPRLCRLCLLPSCWPRLPCCSSWYVTQRPQPQSHALLNNP